MVPKLVLIVAVIGIPLAGIAGIDAASSVASATPPPPAVVCPVSGTITFPAPGLSTDGVFTNSPTSAGSIVASLSPGNCPGVSPHMPAQTLTVPNVHCVTSGNPSPVCTSGSGYVSDSASGYVTAGATFWSEFPTHTRFHIDNVSYRSTSTSSTVIGLGGSCGPTDPGFKVNGSLTAPAANFGDPTHLTLCLATDTGTGTSGNFNNDLTAEVAGGAPPGLTIASAGFDSSTSKLKIP
jgi:hypothetical protein